MIIEATENDLDAVCLLGEKFSKLSPNVKMDKEVFKKNWATLIGSGVGKIFISAEMDATLGCLIYPDLNTGIVSAMETFWFVDEKAKGTGLKLLLHFERWAKREGCDSIIMVHLSDVMKDAVKKIYTRFGYKEIETHYMKRL